MAAICMREFISLFKSIRSIIIIAVLLGVTLGTAKLMSNFSGELSEMGLDSPYIAGLTGLLMLAGPLFVMSLSHDTVNREAHSRTMRFLVTKISINRIVLGKFLGIMLFWSVCLFISIILLIPFAKAFYAKELIETMCYMSYFVTLALFLSSVIRKPGLSLFIGMVVSIALPLLGFWGAFTETKVVLIAFSYITPYFYISQESTNFVYFIPLLSSVLLGLSLLLSKKRDY
ncbi:ABC transporter permease [Alkalihalobacillus sp. R86527]|uniref:ABC transporter permease n=1 Tax=Alkalihalobacillus sp. R86527 TaxID=3093863 RepID=UPI0036711713